MDEQKDGIVAEAQQPNKPAYMVGIILKSGMLHVEFNARPWLTQEEAFDLAIATVRDELEHAKLDYVV